MIVLTVSPKSLTILQQMFDGQPSTISSCDSHMFCRYTPLLQSPCLPILSLLDLFVVPLLICGEPPSFLFQSHYGTLLQHHCILKQLTQPKATQSKWYREPKQCWILQILDLKLWTILPQNTIVHSLTKHLTLGCFVPLPCDLSIPSPPISCGFVAPRIPQTDANTSA